ncbi:MAG: hypothetical protein GY756_25670 [bacterium]|nr:hypothetical protein [bacterium]
MEEILHYGIYVIYGLLIFFILKTVFSSPIKNHHSSWNTLIDDFNFSSQKFYELLKEDIETNNVKDISTSHVKLKEGNIFSSKRLYMRIEWREFQYDICAAPFGKGFFISWWLLYKNSLGQILISKIPFIGIWLMKKLFPTTYYKIDTASMFMSYAHQSVMNVLKDISVQHGTRLLTESERKPMLQNIFKR